MANEITLSSLNGVSSVTADLQTPQEYSGHAVTCTSVAHVNRYEYQNFLSSNSRDAFPTEQLVQSDLGVCGQSKFPAQAPSERFDRVTLVP